MGEPASEAEVATLVAPPEIKEMLRLASEWHLSRDYWGVNLFKGWREDLNTKEEDNETLWMDKVAIIGDAEMVQEWADDHDSPNCGQDDWQCFASVSEYDYLFVCVTPGEQFGATRHM